MSPGRVKTKSTFCAGPPTFETKLDTLVIGNKKHAGSYFSSTQYIMVIMVIIPY